MKTLAVKPKFLSFIDWVVQPYEAKGPDEVRKARVLTYLTFLGWPICFGFVAQFIQLGSSVMHWGMMALIGILIMLLPFFIHLVSSVQLWGTFFCFLCWLLFVWLPWFDGGVFNGGLINFPFIPLVAVVLLRRKDVIIWVLMSSIVIAGYYLAEYHFGIPFPRPMGVSETARVIMFALIATVITITGIFYFYENTRSKLHAEVQARVKELEEKSRVILEQQKMLVHSAQMSALGEMAGGVAHEINNPLAIIRGKTLMLARMIKDNNDPKVTKLLEGIDGTVDRVAKIVDGLMRFHRADQNQSFEKYPIQTILEDVKTLVLERFTTKNIQLTIEDQSNNAVIECRPMEVAQILMNLLNNAYDILESNRNGERAWIHIEVEREPGDKFLAIRVYDSGPPVPEELRDKIFYPFFTTKEVGKGTGLGLSVSLGIAEAHGGELKLSPPEDRKYFLLRLPMSPHAPQSLS